MTTKQSAVDKVMKREYRNTCTTDKEHFTLAKPYCPPGNSRIIISGRNNDMIPSFRMASGR